MTRRTNFPEKSVRQKTGVGLDTFVQLSIYVNCISHFAVVVSSSLDLCETRFLYTPTRSGSLSGRNL